MESRSGTLTQGQRTETLSEGQMDRAVVSSLHSGPLLLGELSYAIEGDRVGFTDGVSTLATTLYHKDDMIYADRDVDQGRVNFEVKFEDRIPGTP